MLNLIRFVFDSTIGNYATKCRILESLAKVSVLAGMYKVEEQKWIFYEKKRNFFFLIRTFRDEEHRYKSEVFSNIYKNVINYT